MAYKIKNITYLLDKSDRNSNSLVKIKVKTNFVVKYVTIAPYQEIIWDYGILSAELHKLQMKGYIQVSPATSKDMNEAEKPEKKEKPKKKVVKEEPPKKKPKPKPTKEKEVTESKENNENL